MRCILQSKSGARDDRHGFTLIELLVVISIVTLLISVLLPALQMARQAGQKTRCLSNIRQIFIGINSFETDYRYLPFLYNSDPSGPYGPQKYMAERIVREHYLIGGLKWGHNGEVYDGVLTCPTIKTLDPGFRSNSYATTYGFNSLFRTYKLSDSFRSNVPLRLDQLSQAISLSKAIGAMDGFTFGTSHVNLSTNIKEIDPDAVDTVLPSRSMHLKRTMVNVMLMDGHAISSPSNQRVNGEVGWGTGS